MHKLAETLFILEALHGFWLFFTAEIAQQI